VDKFVMISTDKAVNRMWWARARAEAEIYVQALQAKTLRNAVYHYEIWKCIGF
jgi:FlaA1/EpsC-like NDP-sugar epimerase